MIVCDDVKHPLWSVTMVKRHDHRQRSQSATLVSDDGKKQCEGCILPHCPYRLLQLCPESWATTVTTFQNNVFLLSTTLKPSTKTVTPQLYLRSTSCICIDNQLRGFLKTGVTIKCLKRRACHANWLRPFKKCHSGQQMYIIRPYLLYWLGDLAKVALWSFSFITICSFWPVVCHSWSTSLQLDLY